MPLYDLKSFLFFKVGSTRNFYQTKTEYWVVAKMLNQECQSGRMKPITCGALCELASNVVEKLASKYDNVEKEVTEVMGGKVLNYRSKEIYQEGMKEGITLKTIELVTRKGQLGDSPEKIAKDLFMSVEEVEEILGKAISGKAE